MQYFYQTNDFKISDNDCKNIRPWWNMWTNYVVYIFLFLAVLSLSGSVIMEEMNCFPAEKCSKNETCFENESPKVISYEPASKYVINMCKIQGKHWFCSYFVPFLLFCSFLLYTEEHFWVQLPRTKLLVKKLLHLVKRCKSLNLNVYELSYLVLLKEGLCFRDFKGSLTENEKKFIEGNLRKSFKEIIHECDQQIKKHEKSKLNEKFHPVENRSMHSEIQLLAETTNLLRQDVKYFAHSYKNSHWLRSLFIFKYFEHFLLGIAMMYLFVIIHPRLHNYFNCTLTLNNEENLFLCFDPQVGYDKIIVYSILGLSCFVFFMCFITIVMFVRIKCTSNLIIDKKRAKMMEQVSNRLPIHMSQASDGSSDENNFYGDVKFLIYLLSFYDEEGCQLLLYFLNPNSLEFRIKWCKFEHDKNSQNEVQNNIRTNDEPLWIKSNNIVENQANGLPRKFSRQSADVSDLFLDCQSVDGYSTPLRKWESAASFNSCLDDTAV